MSYVETKLKSLESRIEKLEKRRVGKVGEMADWIIAKLDDDGYMPVRKIKRAANEMGYSWQMLQRVRREKLGKQIVVKHTDNGWIWKKTNFQVKALNFDNKTEY